MWKVKVSQLYLTLWNPMDCSLPSSSVHGILQARILEWVAVPFSRGSSQPRDWTQVSCIAGGLEWAAISSSRESSWLRSNPCLLCLLHWQAGHLPLVLPGKPCISDIIRYLSFCYCLSDFTSLSTIISRSTRVAAGGISSSFLWLSTILLCICTASFSPISLLVDIYVASLLWLL